MSWQWKTSQAPVALPNRDARKLAKLLRKSSRHDVLEIADSMVCAVGRSFSELGKGNNPQLMLKEVERGLAALQLCLDVLRGNEIPETPETTQPALPGPHILQEARAAQFSQRA